MTQEEKQLLFQDLCGRLPYNTMITVNDGKYRKDVKLHPHYIFDWDAERWDAKPYLRPMSSMTGKEWMEYCDACVEDEKSWVWAGKEYKFTPVTHREEFLNSHHFDYRGLIEKGLALEAPEDMYTKLNKL